jgi:hypothetical protein
VTDGLGPKRLPPPPCKLVSRTFENNVYTEQINMLHKIMWNHEWTVNNTTCSYLWIVLRSGLVSSLDDVNQTSSSFSVPSKKFSPVALAISELTSRTMIKLCHDSGQIPDWKKNLPWNMTGMDTGIKEGIVIIMSFNHQWCFFIKKKTCSCSML